MNTLNKYTISIKDAIPKPNTFRKKVRFSLRKMVLDYLAMINNKNEKNFMRCIYCHYVFDDQVEDFDKLIKELKNIGDFVDTKTCLDILENKNVIDGKYFHLSFDDGFKNNFINAFPILKKYKIPSIFFVPTSLIEADWNKTEEFCLVKTNYGSVIQFMDWADILEMDSYGYEFGSHTANHVRLSDPLININELNKEIMESKEVIEKKLGKKCNYISWPFGELKDVNNQALEIIKNVGYLGCFGAFRGSVITNKTNRFMIPRHHFEVEWPISHTKYFLRGNMEKNI